VCGVLLIKEKVVHMTLCMTYVVKIRLCPEPFAGIEYNWNECLVMKKYQRFVIRMKL
jgi:hypothetical protein